MPKIPRQLAMKFCCRLEARLKFLNEILAAAILFRLLLSLNVSVSLTTALPDCIVEAPQPTNTPNAPCPFGNLAPCILLSIWPT